MKPQTPPAPAPPPQHDMDWLFNNCESEMGIVSNFGSMIAVLKSGASIVRRDKDTDELVNGAQEAIANEDTIIDALDARRGPSRATATRRNRRVLATFRTLAPEHKRTFEAAYEARQVPPRVRETFRHLAGVAHLTATARKNADFSMKWLSRAIAKGDARAAAIRNEADTMFKAAVEAYEAVR